MKDHLRLTQFHASVPIFRLAASLVLLLALPGPAGIHAQEVRQRLPSGALGHLIWPREGSRIAHYSSRDRTGGNADFVSIAPGETFTLVDHAGAGVLRRWWLTIAPRNDVEIQRGLVVRCYWDGEDLPSVEVPVSDFFGMGFGLWKDYTSLPLNMTSGGYNSYWPMPFKESARITVENTSGVPIATTSTSRPAPRCPPKHSTSTRSFGARLQRGALR